MIDYAAHQFPGQAESTVFVGLGGNIGNRLDFLRRALFSLLVHPEIRVVAVSRVYETQYVGPGTQDSYLNACIEIRSSLVPNVLLTVLKGVETRLGREVDSHLQPRPIDLDILLVADLVLQQPHLQVPHPRARERAFVLEPLNEIAPDTVFPDSGETVADSCARIRGQNGPWVRVREDHTLLPCCEAASKEDWRAALAVYCR